MGSDFSQRMPSSEKRVFRLLRSCRISNLSKEFCDSDGDGVGDIRGVISKLDYIRELGANGRYAPYECAVYDLT